MSLLLRCYKRCQVCCKRCKRMRGATLPCKRLVDTQLNGVRNVRVPCRNRARLGIVKNGPELTKERCLCDHIGIGVDALQAGSPCRADRTLFLRSRLEHVVDEL